MAVARKQLVLPEDDNKKPFLNISYLENPMMRQPKMKHIFPEGTFKVDPFILVQAVCS